MSDFPDLANCRGPRFRVQYTPRALGMLCELVGTYHREDDTYVTFRVPGAFSRAPLTFVSVPKDVISGIWSTKAISKRPEFAGPLNEERVL